MLTVIAALLALSAGSYTSYAFYKNFHGDDSHVQVLFCAALGLLALIASFVFVSLVLDALK